MDIPSNPFEHHHHHHDGDHDDVAALQIDPAHQSLADALRVTFLILRVVMGVVVVLYLVSNMFNVDQGHRKVRLLFGGIQGEPGRQALEPGGPYFALPYPINEVLDIDVTPKQLSLDTEFWFEVSDADRTKRIDDLAGTARPLNPEKDGSLLTGDANIVHAKWSVIYAIRADRVVDYLQNVGVADTKDAQDQRVEQLVRDAVEQGVVHTVAGMTADAFIRSNIDLDAATARINTHLDALGTGIAVSNLTPRDQIVPLAVRTAWQAVINADSERGKKIDDAQRERSRITAQTAGRAYDAVWGMIQNYERARATGDDAQIKQAGEALDQALTNLELQTPGGLVSIGGEVAGIMNEARTYRTQIVQQARADSNEFLQLLPSYIETPRIVESRLWQSTKQKVLSNMNVESIYLPPGQIRLEFNRDPDVRKRREEQILKAEQKQR